MPEECDRERKTKKKQVKWDEGEPWFDETDGFALLSLLAEPERRVQHLVDSQHFFFPPKLFFFHGSG